MGRGETLVGSVGVVADEVNVVTMFSWINFMIFVILMKK